MVLPRHLQILSNKLAEAALVGGKRIIVSMPPRHGKSETSSHYAPIWYLDKFPERRVILASYAADYASEWGRKVRNSMDEHHDRLKVTLAKDSKAADRWNTRQGGGMVTTGVGGPLTGRGADLLLIDDPIKNWADAYSPTVRQRIWEWYLSTAYTRLEPNASIVIVMTRWHEDDLVGRLLRQMKKGEGENWDVIRFPATAETDDPLGRPLEAPLWPFRYDADALARTKRSVGPLVWAGLFQQNPVPSEFQLFPEKNWQFYKFAPALKTFIKLIQSWDMSFKDLKTSDYVVGQVWGFQKARAYLRDQARGRMSFDGAVRAMKDMCEAWPTARPIYVEDAANGPAIISHLRGEIAGFQAITPRGSKEARAAAIQPFSAAGNIWLPDQSIAPWVTDFVDEHRSFPMGTNDDQVDAHSQAINQVWLTGGIIDESLDFDLKSLHQESQWAIDAG